MERKDKLINRIGEEKYNTFGTLMKIVEYNSNKDITIEFQDKHKVRIHTKYVNFKKGNVKNPYDREVCGVGYYGIGKYTACVNKKPTKAYNTWRGMIIRCYDPYEINKRPTYKDCFVCDEWLNFQNFAKWYYKNYYEIDGEQMHLDKDILCKSNKIYSPETCCLVPERINTLFVKCDKVRGEYPIGVNYCKDSNKLKVRCCVYENGKTKRIYLGCFPLNRPFQAFIAYKKFKENYIKQVADEYKNLIPNKLYEAMYVYEVEIND